MADDEICGSRVASDDLARAAQSKLSSFGISFDDQDPFAHPALFRFLPPGSGMRRGANQGGLLEQLQVILQRRTNIGGEIQKAHPVTPSALVGAALMVGGPSSRIKPRAIKQLARIATDHAAEVSRTLGWLP